MAVWGERLSSRSPVEGAARVVAFPFAEVDGALRGLEVVVV
jgi:hypothetical protein